MRNCEKMENTLKINVFGKSILFCKYLPNQAIFGSEYQTLTIISKLIKKIQINQNKIQINQNKMQINQSKEDPN